MSRVKPDRLAAAANPVTLLSSAAPWAATAYLASYIPVGAFLFAVTATVVLVTQALSLFWLGLPLLAISAVIVRGAAEVERGRIRLVGDRPQPNYREVTTPGILSQITTRWTDPSTIRNLTYLLALFPLLLILDAFALGLWLLVLSMVVLPLWFWAIPHTLDSGAVVHGVLIGFPQGGPDGYGFWIDDLPSALLVTLVFAVVAVPAARLVVGAARLHRAVGNTLLGRYEHPLAEAHRILAEPGPLALEPFAPSPVRLGGLIRPGPAGLG